MSVALRQRLDEAYAEFDRITEQALAAVHDHSALSFELEAQVARQLAGNREERIRIILAADRLRRSA